MKYKNKAYYTREGSCRAPGCACTEVSTLWGDWCYEHNVERMERLNREFGDIAAQMGIAWVPFEGQFATEEDL